MFPAIGVLGCGYWGSNHIKTLSLLGNLYAVADIDNEKATNKAKEYGVNALSPEDMLKYADIDAIVIALPPQFHAQYAEAAIINNKHVLVEKPISLDVDSAQKVVDIAAKHGKILAVGHILRFHNVFQKIQELVNSGAIGEVKYISSTRLGFGKFHSKSDAMWDLAPHDLSLILAIAGRDFISVNKDSSNIIDSKGIDFVNIGLDFRSIKAQLRVSRLSPYRERKFMVVGSKAIILWDDLKPVEEKLSIYKYDISKDELCWDGQIKDAEYIAIENNMPLTDELINFISSIKNNVGPLTPGIDGVDVLKILTA